MTMLLSVIRIIGLRGIALAMALVFYEGLPGANYVTPYLRVVPAIGPLADDLAQGRVGRARDAGRRDERLVWQEKQRRADLAREIARREAEVKIDQVERDYLSRQTADTLRIFELERTLEEEQTRILAAGCGPAVSRKLRDAIDRIGRD